MSWHMRRGAPKPKSLCSYLVEVNGAANEFINDAIEFMRSYFADRIFADNEDDCLVITTSNPLLNVKFDVVTWNLLKTLEEELKPVVNNGETSLPQKAVEVLELMKTQEEEETYKQYQLFIFTELKKPLQESDLQNLSKQAAQQQVVIRIAHPKDMDASQESNKELFIKKLTEYEVQFEIKDIKERLKQVTNTLSKKYVRPSPWNVTFELGSSLKIEVSGFVCTRKNTMTEMKKALEKHKPKTVTYPQRSGMPGSANGAISSNQSVAADGTASSALTQSQVSIAQALATQKQPEVESAKEATTKETHWRQNDGDNIDHEDVGKAYYFGDKLIPFNDIEKQEDYKSGPKCLKLLFCCPEDLIKPHHLVGNGTTLFLPKSNDKASDLKFGSFVAALYQLRRVAIVRKVYKNDSRVTMGVLSPDLPRRALVFTELCFADDIHTPHFPTLLKDSMDKASEPEDKNEKLVDQLILSSSIDFSIENGPVDPAAKKMRESVAKKILGETFKSSELDSISSFFEPVALSDSLLHDLKEAFPLVVSKVKTERPAGANIFPKREADDISRSVECEMKKPKIENGSEINASVVADDGYDVDELMDQL